MGFSELLYKANGGDHAKELQDNRERSAAEEAARAQAIKKVGEDAGLIVMRGATANNIENTALHGVDPIAPNGTTLEALPPVVDSGELPESTHEEAA